MASFYHIIPEPDDLIVCPFDKVHVVAAKRFQYHILKCKKNHPGKDFAVCSFNAKHYVLKQDERNHLLNCPDRHMIERIRLAEESGNNWIKGNTDVPSYFPDVVIPDEENWDDDPPIERRIGVQARDVAGIGYMKDMKGMRPAEKRQYYRNLLNKDTDANIALMEKVSLHDPPVPPNASISSTRNESDEPIVPQPFSARGRGRGRAMALQASATPPKVGVSSAPESSNVPAKEVDVAKLIRKTRKKLKEIDHLVERQMNGESLNEQERVKVSLKKTLEVHLKSLEQQHQTNRG